ncbi:hemolysin family protein [Enemella sp. A6]|uniref:hemolysin family protein n=1 Tax=Enemella sp. A6 TaxID=3440152 RepID=UPI003EB79871
MTEWLLIGCVVLLIAANALFVAAEFSFITVDRPTVRKAAESGDRRADGLQQALRTMSTQLSGAQLGITVSSLVVGFIAEPSISKVLRGPLGWAGLNETAALATSLTMAFLIATIAQMVFGELVPKNWAISEPLRVGRMVAGPQRVFTFISKPLLFVLQGSANGLLRLFGIEPQEELVGARSAAELAAMASRSASEGTLEQSLARRVMRSATLGEQFATDAMTPRPKMQYLTAEATALDVLALSESTGHARFPVFGETPDEVLGAVHFKDALAVPHDARATTPVTEIAREVVQVPSAMALDDALEQLRGGLQMAIVVDEYGGTDGLLALEDIVEELVGEIDDEHDKPSLVERDLGDGRWSLSGLMRPDEIEHLELPEGEASETLGGLITEELGRFPRIGDHVDIEARDLNNRDDDGLPTPVRVRLSVTRLEGKRVERLVLRILPDEDGDGS